MHPVGCVVLTQGDFNAPLNLSGSLVVALSFSDAERLARFGTQGCALMAGRLHEILQANRP
jgi:hypothetical protein